MPFSTSCNKFPPFLDKLPPIFLMISHRSFQFDTARRSDMRSVQSDKMTFRNAHSDKTTNSMLTIVVEVIQLLKQMLIDRSVGSQQRINIAAKGETLAKRDQLRVQVHAGETALGRLLARSLAHRFEGSFAGWFAGCSFSIFAAPG